MKKIFQFIIIILFGFLISSCTHKEKDKVYESMYNGFNQIRNMENDDPLTPSDKKSPTYQQYKEERQKILE